MNFKLSDSFNRIIGTLKKYNTIFENKIDRILDFFGSYYFYIIILLNILYVLLFFGILSINYIYVNYLNVGIQIFTCIFLLLRFHPYRKHKITKYDSIIITHSAIFLLINLLLVEGVKNILDKKPQPEIINVLQTITNAK
jgi:hypothetical protein